MSGKWKLLQDLRAVNDCMEIIGAAQLVLPQPVSIPAEYHLLVIDKKDCFSPFLCIQKILINLLPLHLKDSDKFASTASKRF